MGPAFAGTTRAGLVGFVSPKCATLACRVPGAAQHIKGVHARLRGLWWCAADPGPSGFVAVPDHRCHSASSRAFTPVFDGLWTRVTALMAPLRYALHRVRDTR